MVERFNCCGEPFTLDLLKKIVIDAKQQYFRFCKTCVSGNPVIHDVYIGKGSGVQYEENIADPKTGDPIPFYDKPSKLAAMKQAGVREAGDRIHGARNEEYLKRKTYI